jgi:surface protein
MSLRTPSNSNLAVPGLTNPRSLSGQTVPQPYARPTDWVTIGTSTATEYVQMLVSVFNNTTNFISFTSSGATTIDWGDGTGPENVASGVQANHNYVYSNVSNLSSRGYRQAVITVTPQSGQNITAFSIQKKHPSVVSVGITTPILEMTLKVPNITTLANLVFSGSVVSPYNLEQVNILKHGLTSFASLFASMNFSVRSINADCSGVTSFASMCNGSNLINTLNLYNVDSVVDTSNMFNSCSALVTAPFFNTQSVTNMGSMFRDCTALRSVPLYNTRSVTSMSSMFNGCSSLTLVPLFNTQSVTNMANAFQGCISLQTVPLFNTQSVTSMTGMFSGASSLISLPLFNTVNVTDFSNMLFNCRNLIACPPFNTSSGTTVQAMLSSCISLTSVPAFDFSKTTGVGSSSVFSSAQKLRETGVLTVSTNAGNSYSNIFQNCISLSRCPITGTNATISFLNCNLGGAAIDEIFSGLSNTGSGKTITMTGNWGTSTATRSIATTKGWTVVL